VELGAEVKADCGWTQATALHGSKGHVEVMRTATQKLRIVT
jgi:hypothetical protein